MIHRLQIKGFKCFDDADFSFSNLTLLAGKNSMGKSTVIQAILAMIQDGNNPFMGPYINIGKISELKNKYVGSHAKNGSLPLRRHISNTHKANP